MPVVGAGCIGLPAARELCGEVEVTCGEGSDCGGAGGVEDVLQVADLVFLLEVAVRALAEVVIVGAEVVEKGGVGVQGAEDVEVLAVDGLESADVIGEAHGEDGGRGEVGRGAREGAGQGGCRKRGRDGGLAAVGRRVVDIVHEQDQGGAEERDQAEQARQRGRRGRRRRVRRGNVHRRQRRVVGGDSLARGDGMARKVGEGGKVDRGVGHAEEGGDEG